mmetsp:Transcript_81634/g.264473  ORF Transcript_81634/g.264473 Transcript_81634/m.264473 type:complete len:504 (-) Transcript_81634:45-1556(-)
MSQHWPKGKGEDPAELHFDGFDLDACGLAVFRLASDRFKVIPGELACEPDSPAAALLRQLSHPSHVPWRPGSLVAEASDLKDAAERHPPSPARAAAKTGPSTATGDAPVVTGFALPHAGARGAADATAPALVEADSDDEDDDDPLRGLAPLPPLKTPLDSCADLRLVQPPGFLRSGYEMLLGPAKGSDDVQSDAKGSSSSGTSSEPPATAHARINTALASLPALVRAEPPELAQLAGPLCARLLRLGSQPGLENLGKQRKAALVSLLVAERGRRAAAQHLIVEFASEDLSLSGRCLVLEVLADAAKELSNRTACDPGQPTEAVPAAPVAPSAPATTALATAAATAAPPSRTRRFASATRVPASRPNRFSAELRHFLLPLIARWRQPDQGAARWAAGDASVVGSLLQCVGVLLECGGKACPDRDEAAEACLDLVEEFFSHQEPYVRRCSVFVLSRVVLVGCDAALLSRSSLVERIEAAPLREGDETCRKMLGGMLTWLSQCPSL